MKIWVIALLTASILLCGVFVAKVTGIWDGTDNGSGNIKAETLQRFSEDSSPENIRGSYTFHDIEVLYGIDASDLAVAFQIEAFDPSIIGLSDLENLYNDLEEGVEIGTGSIKWFVSIYTGLEYIHEGDYLPSGAIAFLTSKNLWTKDLESQYGDFITTLPQTSYLYSSEILDAIHAEEEFGESLDTGSSLDEPLNEFSGKTTVSDLLEMGISQSDIESILGMKIPNNHMTVRDICNANEISYSTVKSEIMTLLDSLDQ